MHMHRRVPRSQRSGEIIEPLVSEQWFVRMEPLAKPALAAVADGTIRIMPERFERVYNNWLENIKVGVRQGSVYIIYLNRFIQHIGWGSMGAVTWD